MANVDRVNKVFFAETYKCLEVFGIHNSSCYDNLIICEHATDNDAKATLKRIETPMLRIDALLYYLPCDDQRFINDISQSERTMLYASSRMIADLLHSFRRFVLSEIKKSSININLRKVVQRNWKEEQTIFEEHPLSLQITDLDYNRVRNILTNHLPLEAIGIYKEYIGKYTSVIPDRLSTSATSYAYTNGMKFFVDIESIDI